MNFISFYGILALITSFLFIGQMIIGLIGGIGDGLDLDTDTDSETDVGSDDTAGFELSSLVSPKGALHFLLGGSWYLVLADYTRGGFLTWYDYLIAIGVGFILALIMALVYWGMSKLADEKKKESGTELVGRGGSIYLANNDSSIHIISIVLNGATSDLTVKSKSGKKYEVGDLVTILSYENGIYYIE
jgi:hypothetical protein